MGDRHHLLRIAEILLKNGGPIPVDLQAKLVALGIDVEALIRKHG